MRHPDPILPIILCGGQGTRLWPMSRSTWPKQFLSLGGPASLFQRTLSRVADSRRFLPPIVVTNENYRFIAQEQSQQIGQQAGAILLEPVARSTAAAIAAAVIYTTVQASAKGDQLLLVLPSDHEIADADAFQQCIEAAAKAAEAGALVTFGITPTEPATGFGYVEAGEERFDGVRSVVRFVEKPPRPDAESMVASGRFFWNSGIFLFRADALLSEASRYAPAVVDAARLAVLTSKVDLGFTRLDAAAFSRSPNISVDYAIFERTDRAVVVPSNIGWSDLGSWAAVWKASDQDASGNASLGPAVITNSTSSLVVTEGLHVTVDGLDDVAVVASADAVFVGRLSASERVGELVKQLAANAATSHLAADHLTSFRPWGGYTSLLKGERFQVKRLFVKPGKRLSLQKHQHRAEHWVVVSGVAETTVGEEIHTLAENESIYIPLGAVHRLANPGKGMLEIIEVQTGTYFGEDDIIRIDDEYGRR